MRLNVLGAFLSCMGLLLGSAEARAMSPAGAAAHGSAGGQAPAPAGAAVAPSVEKGAAKLQKGGELFSSLSCGGCHTLLGAGATGRVGPSFDGNSNLDEAYIGDRVTNGSGLMPPFGGQMSQDDVAAVASYILQVKGK
jgi:mono/diheme cytochrome c family protein